MEEGTVVSRNELFGQDTDHEPIDDTTNIYEGFAFQEVQVDDDSGQENLPESISTAEVVDAEEEDVPALEFQLFAGERPMEVTLRQKQQDMDRKRPISYYFFQPNAQKRIEFHVSAVTGGFVLDEAKFWRERAAKNPIADDINKDFVPKKRKCRPGKQARLNKKLHNEKVDRLRKEEQQMWKNRRRGGFFHSQPRRKRD